MVRPKGVEPLTLGTGIGRPSLYGVTHRAIY